ncbi:MAG: ABC transporter ATP-binding protein [Candidatus Hodarchaeales archaeon]
MSSITHEIVNSSTNQVKEDLLTVFISIAIFLTFSEISGLTRTATTEVFSPVGILLRIIYLLAGIIGIMGLLTDSKINLILLIIASFFEIIIQGFALSFNVSEEIFVVSTFMQLICGGVVLLGLSTFSKEAVIELQHFEECQEVPAVEIKSLHKIYEIPGSEVRVNALRGVDMVVNKGDFIAIMGPSGSGKSTLLNMIGALDKPTKGTIHIDGVNILELDNKGLAFLRNRKIGFVFQSYNLIARSNVLQNVEIPGLVRKIDPVKRRAKAIGLLKKVGLGSYLHRKPKLLSGGEQQRVAIARALLNEPTILLCDEPTGNLDSKSGHQVMEILKELNRDMNVTVIVVTHDPEVGAEADRIYYLKDGLIEGIKENIKF